MGSLHHAILGTSGRNHCPTLGGPSWRTIQGVGIEVQAWKPAALIEAADEELDRKFQGISETRSFHGNCPPNNSVRPDMDVSAVPPKTSPFRSFWMGGFECSDKLNAFGRRVDLLETTNHLDAVNEDYANLSLLSIGTVREGIRWSQIEKIPYIYDWRAVRRLIEAASCHGIQQVWDICHFGFPDDLTPLHPMFPRRFAAVCKAFALLFRSMEPDLPLIVTPINEVSFLSWLGGDVRGTTPYCVGQGWEVKYRLMKAYIEGVEALKAVDPEVRILTTEPLVNIISETGATESEESAAQHEHENQFQVTDILTGKICPELRGRPDYLDLMGVNFYYQNQWVKRNHEFMIWTQRTTDKRWTPLHRLLQSAYLRYGRPLVLSETSHPKEDRPLWISMIGEECEKAFALEVPLLGVCWYPIIDRPDWDDLTTWHQAGLWDRKEDGSDNSVRVLHAPSAEALIRVQSLLAPYVSEIPVSTWSRSTAPGTTSREFSLATSRQ